MSESTERNFLCYIRCYPNSTVENSGILVFLDVMLCPLVRGYFETSGTTNSATKGYKPEDLNAQEVLEMN